MTLLLRPGIISWRSTCEGCWSSRSQGPFWPNAPSLPPTRSKARRPFEGTSRTSRRVYSPFVTGLTPGVYRVSGELSGFKRFERRDVLLEVGKTTTLDLTMEVGGLEDQVVRWPPVAVYRPRHWPGWYARWVWAFS